MGAPNSGKNFSCIYMMTSPSGKIYVGRTINYRKRYNSYNLYKGKEQTKLKRSILKYGFEAHNMTVVLRCDVFELNFWEAFYIKLFDTFDGKFGLNLTSGGDCFLKSEETKKRIGESNKGRVISEEARKRASVTQKSLHSSLTKEEKEQRALALSKALKGKPKSEEWKKKAAASKIGKKREPFSEEWMSKLRDIGNQRKGKPLSDKHLEAIRNGSKKRKEEGRYKLSQEQIESLRKANIGRPIPQEQKDKISNTLKGRVFSQETLNKMKQRAKEIWAKRRDDKNQTKLDL
jgi:group I intron endonuclease